MHDKWVLELFRQNPCMRRLLIVVLILASSLGAARRVSASTDCSQWLSEYRQKLEDNQRVHKLFLLASHKLHAYLKHKVVPRPKTPPLLVKTSVKPRPHRPKMSALEMLKRFSVVCGDLPQEESTDQLQPLLKPTTFTLAQPTFMPEEPETSPATSGLPAPPVLLSGPPSGDLPIPPIFTSGPPPGDPGAPGNPGNPPTVPPVPEPSTLLLVGSGASAAIGRAIRSRRSARRR